VKHEGDHRATPHTYRRHPNGWAIPAAHGDATMMTGHIEALAKTIR
jgi:hypothetical protein